MIVFKDLFEFELIVIVWNMFLNWKAFSLKFSFDLAGFILITKCLFVSTRNAFSFVLVLSLVKKC